MPLTEQQKVDQMVHEMYYQRPVLAGQSLETKFHGVLSETNDVGLLFLALAVHSLREMGIDEGTARKVMTKLNARFSDTKKAG